MQVSALLGPMKIQVENGMSCMCNKKLILIPCVLFLCWAAVYTDTWLWKTNLWFPPAEVDTPEKFFVSRVPQLAEDDRQETFFVARGSQPKAVGLIEGSCVNVLEKSVSGQWMERPHTRAEKYEFQYFLDRARDEQGLPRSLQRIDNHCGNVNIPTLKRAKAGELWFRALCDPSGSLPCCYNNECVAKSVRDCKCSQCYDMRQPVFAEFSTWVPSDPTCQITYIESAQEVCQILKNLSIYFVGDSLMRHVYTSVLAFARSNKTQGALSENLSKEIANMCVDQYYRYATACRAAVPAETWECNNTVQMGHQYAESKTGILKVIQHLQGRPNTLLVMGFGIHLNYNIKSSLTEILEPMFDMLSTSTWPKVLWMNPHSPGLLKSAMHPLQLPPRVLKFNAAIGQAMRAHNIPVFEFYNISKGVMSHDGTHFAQGVNDLKAQIFFHYLKELQYNSSLKT